MKIIILWVMAIVITIESAGLFLYQQKVMEKMSEIKQINMELIDCEISYVDLYEVCAMK